MPHYRRKNISHIRLNIEHFCELWQEIVPPSSSPNGAEREPSSDSNKSNGAERDPLHSTQRAPSNRDFGDLEKTLTLNEHVFHEVLQALTTINKQLASMDIKPLTKLPYLAQKIASRGDTVKEMRQAWQKSIQNGDSAIAAFVTWITYGKVPAPRSKTTRRNPQTGKLEQWRPDVGWVER